MLYAVRICWLLVLLGFILFVVAKLLIHVITFTIVVIGAVFFAYLIFPLVRRLNQRMPLGLAIAVVYVSITVLLALGVYLLAPALTSDFHSLVRDVPLYVHKAQAAFNDPNNPLTKHLPAVVRRYLEHLPAELEANISSYVATFVGTVVPIVVSIVAVGALFVVIPVVSVYLLLEADGIKSTFMGFIPKRAQPKTQAIIGDLDRVVGGFLRGQVIVAIIVGSLVTLLLFGLHVRYAVLIGVVAGVLDVIPYVGAIVGWLPAFLIALFTNGADSALAVTAGIVVINQLEGHLIAPNVVSKSVELTPLAVILALIVGGEVAGVLGLLLAVPVAGIVRVLVVNLRPPPNRAHEPLPHKAHKPPLVTRIIGALKARMQHKD